MGVSEGHKNKGKPHQVFYTNDWQYCFCDIGETHFEIVKKLSPHHETKIECPHCDFLNIFADARNCINWRCVKCYKNLRGE